MHQISTVGAVTLPWQPCCMYLVIVVMSMEEGLLPEDHAGQHTAQTPHVQTVVIHLKHSRCVKWSTHLQYFVTLNSWDTPFSYTFLDIFLIAETVMGRMLFLFFFSNFK